MTFYVKDTGSETPVDLPEEGQYIAVCITIAGLGVQQPNPKWAAKKQVLFQWELIDNGHTIVSAFYTLSLNERSNLFATLSAWLGRPLTEAERNGFDLGTLLGTTCRLAISHKQKADGWAYAKPHVMGPASPDTPAIEPKNKPVIYDPDAHVQAAFDLLPGWVQRKITADDDIPF